MPRQSTTLTVLVALLCPMSVGAAVDGTADFSESDMLTELPIQGIASRIHQPVSHAPASITLITREMIEASGALEWVDVFRLIPGFQSYRIHENRIGVGYHDFGYNFPNHLEVMVDGRSVYEPIFSTIQWSVLGISLDDVDYIEVARGSNVPSFGSNAFMGAINIVTKHPVAKESAELNLTTGSRSTRDASLTTYGEIDNFSYRVNLAYNENDGLPPTDDGPMEDGHERRHATLHGIYTPNLRDSIDFQIGYSNEDIGWGDADHPDEYTPADFILNFQSIKWTHDLAYDNTLSLHGSHNRFKGSNFADQGLVSEIMDIPPEYVELIFGIPDQPVIDGFFSLESDRYDLELEHSVTLSPELRAVWGIGGRHEMIRSPALLGHESKVNHEAYRLFAHSEWNPITPLYINLGAMVEDNLTGTLFSPRAGLNYDLNSHHTLRASVARSERSPSLVEKYENNFSQVDGLVYDIIRYSDHDLEEERVTRYELGYLGNIPTTGLQLDVSLFREEGRDIIDEVGYKNPPPPEQLEIYHKYHLNLDYIADLDLNHKILGNILDWNIQGLELQMQYKPSPESLIRLHYAYIDVKGGYLSVLESDEELRDSYENIIPRHSGGLLLAHKLGDSLGGSLFIYRQTTANWRDGDGSPVDGFTRVDAQLTYRFNMGDSDARLRLIGQNLFDDHPDFHPNNVFETRVYLKFEMDMH